MTKWVYNFGDGKAEGQADMRNLLGGKGANLAEMSNIGLPVPPGFTLKISSLQPRSAATWEARYWCPLRMLWTS